MRDLRLPPQTTFEEYLLYLSEHPETADRLLDEGEEWVVEIYGSGTESSFTTVELLGPSGYMSRYDNGLLQAARNPAMTNELIRNVRLMKIGKEGQSEEKTETEYRKKRDAERAEAAAITKRAAKEFETQEKREHRRPSKTSIIKAALEKTAKLQKQVAALRKKFAQIEKAAKRGTKKPAPKKVARKSKAIAKPPARKKVAAKPARKTQAARKTVRKATKKVAPKKPQTKKKGRKRK